VNAAETVRRQCLARTPLATFLNNLLECIVTISEEQRSI
jgi:hypothetical protein